MMKKIMYQGQNFLFMQSRNSKSIIIDIHCLLLWFICLPMGPWPKEGRWAPWLHFSWCMAPLACHWEVWIKKQFWCCCKCHHIMLNLKGHILHSSSLRLSLLSLLTNTLPGPSTSEVTTLWRYTKLFIIIIIIWSFSFLRQCKVKLDPEDTWSNLGLSPLEVTVQWLRWNLLYDSIPQVHHCLPCFLIVSRGVGKDS